MATATTLPGPSEYIVFNKAYRVDPLGAFGQAWKTYGDLICFKGIPGVDVYFVVHPDAAAHILTTHGQVYRKAPNVHEPLRLLLGSGVLIDEGESWLRQRRLMNPAFHRQSIVNLSSVMTRFAQARADQWERSVGSVIDVAEEMQQLTLEIVGEALFSAGLEESIDSFARAFRRAAEFMNDRINTPLLVRSPLWIPTRKHRQFIRDRDRLRKIALPLIQLRRTQENVPLDLLSMLMAAQDADTGARMTDSELLGEVMTLLIAGHETVSVTLSWAFHLLGQHPEVLHRLQAEIETVLNGHPPTADDYQRLAYTRMVIEETLRLYPPVWVLSRETLKHDEIQGYSIPPKSFVIVATYFTHRHPEFWTEPEQFNPERFTESEASKRHKFAYYPFGGGPRICIGNQFALMEATLILATLLQRFRLEPSSTQPVEIDPTFTLRPRNGLPMRLIRR
jgi:cytochrome P450